MENQITAKSQSFDIKRTLGLSLGLLLIINFVLGYIGHTYFSEGLLDVTSPGFWIGSGNFAIITWIVLYSKRMLNWTWSDLGLGKPDNWWKPILIGAGTYAAIMLFSIYLRPFILELGQRPDISHLFVVKQNLPMLVFALLVVWITAAFLEELIFRAFLINSIDTLLGNNRNSLIAAVLISSAIFGLIHSYQGITGILTTGSLGLIFGMAYALNGRRIWPLIIIHGAIDTIGLISIYNLQ